MRHNAEIQNLGRYNGETTAWTTGVAVGEEVTKEGSSTTTSVWGPVSLAFEGALLLSPIFLLLKSSFLNMVEEPAHEANEHTS